MERIKTATAFIDKFGPGKNGFRDGDDTTGVLSTQLEADWFDNPQEEIANAIELSGIALNPADMTQLWQAIRAGGGLGPFVRIAGDTMTGTLTVASGRIISNANNGPSLTLWMPTSALGMWNDTDQLNIGTLNPQGVPGAAWARITAAGFSHLVGEIAAAGSVRSLNGDVYAAGGVFVSHPAITDFFLGVDGPTSSRALNFVGAVTNGVNIVYDALNNALVASLYPVGGVIETGEVWRSASDGTFRTPTHCWMGDTMAGKNFCQRPIETVWDVASDVRGKNVLGDYAVGLAEIIRLQPIRYQYNGISSVAASDQVNPGLSAQDVQAIIPECVKVLPDGMRKLDDELCLNISPILLAYINAFKEIDARLRALETTGPAQRPA
jgi:hypothetical protein